jgi:glutathione S-transferase
MAVTFYNASGSPFTWRVWLALEHKAIAYELKTLSFDAGDLKQPWFLELTPRGKVPVLVDDGFALYESAAIVEYLADKHPGEPRLFSADLHERAVQRRMVCETDQYFGEAVHELVATALRTPEAERSAEKIAAAQAALAKECALWETTLGGDFLAGALSAADFALYPQVALALRFASRNPGLLPAGTLGPRLAAWARRMEGLDVVKKTWPPHWR